MDIYKRTDLIFFVLLVLLFAVPTVFAYVSFQEESFAEDVDGTIRAELVKSVTNKFSQGVGVGGAGGLASTEIEVFSPFQFASKAGDEPTYYSMDFSYNSNGNPYVLQRTYAALIKDHSGVYIYRDRYEREGFIIDHFDGMHIYWRGDNMRFCVAAWIVIFFVMLAGSFAGWRILKRRGFVQ
ncbi:MAG: hypothetical protein PHH21_01725 [Candidatus Pacebacteria bacterium]|nr:hypothetical protein [Candidatus Paceibacterota bacterium]